MSKWTKLAGAGLLSIALAMPVAEIAHAKAGGDDQAALAVGEIIVTAQRRPERLQTVPVSVTAVSSDALKARGLNDLSQMTLAAPSLQAGADNNFSVRGVGTSAFSNSIESSVAFAQDEVNLANPGLVYSFYDLSQVEVLNGPQGLLFGRNASAGLVNVSSARPELGKTSGQFDLELDTRPTAASRSNGVVARGAVNLPLGSSVALRVAGFNEYQRPITAFTGPVDAGARSELDLRRFGVRASLLYKPDDAFSLLAIGEIGQDRGVLGMFDIAYRELGSGSVNAAALTASGITAGPDNITLAGNGGYYRDLDRRGVQTKASYVLDNGLEISDIAAWKSFNRNQQLDTDGTVLNGADINANVSRFDQVSNELRLALPSDRRLSGQAGLYAFHSRLREASQIAGNNYFPAFLLPQFPFCVGATAVPACPGSNDYFLGTDHRVLQTNDSLAAFGQLTYKVTDHLQLIGGGRVTRDIVKIDLVQNEGAYFVAFGSVQPGRSERTTNTNFSYKLGAQYTFGRDAMAYVTYGRGYKGPGFNNTEASVIAPLAIKPETNQNLEVGLKTSWLGRKLTVNLSAFRSIFDNYQVQSFDLTTSSFVTQNAATVKTRGIEMTLTARPVPGLAINANATLLDSHFGDFAGAQCYPGQGCTNYNAAGRKTPLAPAFTGTLDVSYEFQTSGAVRPVVSANYYHRASMNYTIQPYSGTTYGEADILGGSVGVRGDNWRASVFCKNCTDQRVPVALGLESADGNAGIATVQQRFGLNSFRTIGLQLGYMF